MKWLLLLFVITGCNTAPSVSQQTNKAEGIAPDSCDGPDQPVGCCFTNMPASLSPVMQISKPGEAGQPLTISGRLLHADGLTPFAGALMYAYHTDHTGRYTKSGDEKGIQKWHGHLYGWISADDSGRYEIKTIRPASYPNSTIAAHIHAAIREPSGATYYITDFVFADDPFVNEQYIQGLNKYNLPGGSGIVALQNKNGAWSGKRDIVLSH